MFVKPFAIAVLVCSAFWGASPTLYAQSPGHEDNLWTHEQEVNGKKPESRRWADLDGKTVAVEGIAWGVGEKGLGEYVILDGGKVYVDGDQFENSKCDGKPVRVSGVLRVKDIEAALPNAAGFAARRIYVITSPKVKQIDRVTWPWLHTPK